MAARRRSNINLGSWIARIGIPIASLYSSSKGAIETLTRAWAAEFGPASVRERDLPQVPPTRRDRGAAILAPMARARAIPHVGSPVTVVFLAARVGGVVTRVEDGARRLLVLTEEGESVTFALSGATGTFLADGQQSGARLLFDVDPG